MTDRAPPLTVQWINRVEVVSRHQYLDSLRSRMTVSDIISPLIRIGLKSARVSLGFLEVFDFS